MYLKKKRYTVLVKTVYLFSSVTTTASSSQIYREKCFDGEVGAGVEVFQVRYFLIIIITKYF